MWGYLEYLGVFSTVGDIMSIVGVILSTVGDTQNFKKSQFSSFLPIHGYAFWSKFDTDQNFLILFHSSKKHM